MAAAFSWSHMSETLSQHHAVRPLPPPRPGGSGVPSPAAPKRRHCCSLEPAELRAASCTRSRSLVRRASERGAAAAAAAAGPTALVYRATCPLVGWEPLEAALGSRFPSELALHHFVVVEALAANTGMANVNGSALGSRGSSSGVSAVIAFDFLPQHPLSPLTAAALLSGGSVPGGQPACGFPCGGSLLGMPVMSPVASARCAQHPPNLPTPTGVLRRRPLVGVPRLRCQLQGSTWLPDPHAAAEAFQQRFDSQLRLLRNDCTHHADALIAHLVSSGQPAAGAAGGERQGAAGGWLTTND